MNQPHDRGELSQKDIFGLAHLHQEALLEAIFAADPAALAVLIGPDLRYAFVNPAYRFLHADNGHELIGTRYADAGLHHNHMAYSEKLRTVYTTGVPYLQEKVEHSYPDGTCRILTLQARRFDWGLETAVLLILWDTTELNEAKNALEASIRVEKQKTAQLEAFLEVTPALVWIAHDRESRVITGNTYSSEFLRMRPGDNLSKTAPEEQIPHHYRPVKDGRDIPADQLPVQKAAASGEPVRDYDFDVEFEDGEVRHLFGNAAPLLDETGQPYGAVSAFVDITERKRAEEQLREALQAASQSEKRYHNLFDQMTEGFALHEIGLDQDGIPVDYRFLEANPAFEKLTGLTRKDIIGKWKHEIPQLAGDDPAWIEIYGKVALTGESVRFENYSPALKRHYEVFAYRPVPGQFAVQFLDITERKQMEEALRVSDEKFTKAFRYSPNAITITRLSDGIIIEGNESAYELFGYSHEEVVGKSTFDLDIWADPADRMKLVKELSSKGCVNHQEIILKRKDHTQAIVDLSASLITINGQQCFLSSFIDITARKQAEEKIRESQMLLRAVIENTQDPVYVKDRQGHILLANQALANVVGKPIEDLVGKTDSEYYEDEEIGQALRENDLKVMASEAGLSVEETVMTQDGWRTYLSAKAPYRDPEGKVIGIIGISRDITERKRVEGELAASETRNRDLLESIQDGFMQLDREWRFSYINQRAAKNVGWEPEALLGKNIWEAFPNILGSEHERYYRQVMETRQPAHFEMDGVFTQGCYDIRVYPSQDGISVFWVDITDRIHAEKETRSQAVKIELQRKLLAQREQERIQIARELHDGPMQEITGCLYAVHGMITSGVDDNLTNGLRSVSATLQEQLEELRAFSQDLRPPALAHFGVDGAIRAHLETFKAKHPDLQVTLEASQEGELLPEPTRLALFRIYQEAMNNIAKHCRNAEVRVIFRKCEENASLEISDDGCGFELPEDWLELARAGHLGLVGMRERAEAMGGKLEIESKPGAGTTIRVEVPLGEGGSSDKKQIQSP